MSTVYPKFKDGGIVPTYVNTGTVPILGGMVVEFYNGGVRPCSADSFVVAGVAVIDSNIASVGDFTATTDAFGNQVVDVTVPGNTVAVDCGGAWKNLTCVAATAAGEQIKAAANGAVTRWVQGTDDAGKIIGRCIDAAGAASASTSALFKIRV